MVIINVKKIGLWTVLLTGSVLAGLAILQLLGQQQVGVIKTPAVYTDVSIFIDQMKIASDNHAVLDELTKTIVAECDHIFISKELWIECINCVEEEPFLKTWDLYDTGIGLIYIELKGSSYIGIKVTGFTKIETPLDLECINALKSNFLWQAEFTKLFNLEDWRSIHSNANAKILFYINGHGFPDDKATNDGFVCGMLADNFAYLLDFFHKELHVNFLGVQSCYWTTDRIYRLMKDTYGYTQLNYSIFTPLSQETPVWLDTIGSYLTEGNEQTRQCFFESCAKLTECDEKDLAALTDEVKEIIYNTDTLQLAENKGQKATLLAAGTDNLIIV